MLQLATSMLQHVLEDEFGVVETISRRDSNEAVVVFSNTATAALAAHLRSMILSIDSMAASNGVGGSQAEGLELTMDLLQQDSVALKYEATSSVKLRAGPAVYATPTGFLHKGEQILALEVLRIAKEEMDKDIKKVQSLHNKFYDSVSKIEEIYVNGDMNNKVSNILNISFAYVEGESLIMALKDIAVSSGSACTSASLEPSYVLRALGRKDELASSSIRFSFGRFTTEEDVDYTLSLINHAVDRLRELSPLWEMYLDGIDLDTVEWQTH